MDAGIIQRYEDATLNKSSLPPGQPRIVLGETGPCLFAEGPCLTFGQDHAAELFSSTAGCEMSTSH
jgi:hypothetical protein